MHRPGLKPAPIAIVLLGLSDAAQAQGPSYDCNKVENGSIPALVCADAELSALDRQLAAVYSAASARAANEQPPRLKAEQRDWIKGRDDCWKSTDQHACVAESYRLRITELQARYRLVPHTSSFTFACDDAPDSEVIVTFFATEPPTLIAERGDSVSLMYRQPSASGTRYQGRNESFWEHQDEARVVWGYGEQEMRCRRRR